MRGIIRGPATMYDEANTIHEARCMLRGDEECRITVRTLAVVDGAFIPRR